MIRRRDLFTDDQLNSALEQGLVRERRHPAADLSIFNYTEKAQYENVWDDVTSNCRGLIVDDSGIVVARPWPKFFNYTPGSEIDLSAAAEVTDKLDGSLGILYRHDGQFAVASRGSFDSEQARHATAVYRDRYHGWRPQDGLTYLFEIVYPGNRIVLDYHGADDLFLLGATHTRTGLSVPLADLEWPGPRTPLMPAATIAQALELPPREGAEGLVITVTGTGVKWKVKQEDYVALHRIITGTSELSVWRHLSAGGTVDELVGNTPDEFHTWIREVTTEFTGRHQSIVEEAIDTHRDLVAGLGAGASRKEFAIAAKTQRYPHLLFAVADDNPAKLADSVWKMLRPEGSGMLSPWAAQE